MSFSKSGPEPVANVVGNIEFGKWHLQSTSYKEDVWRKPILNMDGHPEHDSYIEIKRTPVVHAEREFEFEIILRGRSHMLMNPLVAIFEARPPTHDIQVLKDYVDRCITKINNLKAFI